MYEIYQKLNIHIIPLLNLIEYKNKTMFIYPFLEGTNLRDSNLSIKECYKYGTIVGQEIMKLQKYSVDLKVFSNVNMNNYFNKDKKTIKNLCKNEEHHKKILYIFSKEELKGLLRLYMSLLDFIKTQKFLLNHNDIKIANVMLEAQKNYYLIDIDPICLTPTAFNVYYSIYSFLLPQFKENEKGDEENE